MEIIIIPLKKPPNFTLYPAWQDHHRISCVYSMWLLHISVVLLSAVFGVSFAGGSTRQIPCTKAKLWLDVAVAIDYSNNMATSGITFAVNDVLSVFSDVTISQNLGSFTRIAVTNYTNAGDIIFDLDHFNSTSQLMNEIWNVIPDSTIDNDGKITAGLEAASAALESGRSSGKRNNVQQAIILYASQYSALTDQNAYNAAYDLKFMGIKIITVDNSKGQNLSLDEIASPGMDFKSGSPNLPNLLNAALCSVNTFCRSGWTQISDSYPNGLNLKAECISLDFRTLPFYVNRTLAVSQCNTLGGYLVSVFDKEKDDFVKAFFEYTFGPPAWYWLGLSFSISGVRQWDQMPETAPIPMDSNDYTAWYSPITSSNLTSSTPNVGAYASGNWWPLDPSKHNIPVCQTNTCDTDNYCQ